MRSSGRIGTARTEKLRTVVSNCAISRMMLFLVPAPAHGHLDYDWVEDVEPSCHHGLKVSDEYRQHHDRIARAMRC